MKSINDVGLRGNLLQKGMLDYLKHCCYKKLARNHYANYSTIDKEDKDRRHYSQMLNEMSKSKCYDKGFLCLETRDERSVAVLLGLGVCDALGASTEFLPFLKEGYGFIKEGGFLDVRDCVRDKFLDDRAGTIGVWTDDCSMALCIADSLLLCHRFQPLHLRYLFLVWFANGLNNGGRPFSIGLGGNIKTSFEQFIDQPEPFAKETPVQNSGNGSLMRLGPVPIKYRSNVIEAMKVAAESSRTTHNGREASQCCRLLCAIIVGLINRNDEDPKAMLLKICDSFQSPELSVLYLSRGWAEDEKMFKDHSEKEQQFLKYNKSVEDRRWNWRQKDFTYSATRYKLHPGYVGSYCMDALSMALHTVLHTNNFNELALVNANMGGDSDTVGAIAGQIGGAIYGLDQHIFRLYFQMEDCQTKTYQIFIKAIKLIFSK